MRSNGKSFTFLEILTTIVILGIISFLALIPLAQWVENSKAKTCEANLRLIKHALDLYMLDHDYGPQSLSHLPKRYFSYACSQLNNKRRIIKLSGLSEYITSCSIAFAEPFIYTLAEFDLNLISCPKDNTPPTKTGGQTSYALYKGLIDMGIKRYQQLNSTVVLIGDSDEFSFNGEISELKCRHIDYLKRKRFGLGIRKDNTIVRNEISLTKE
ncbi:MAG: hypothetical protein N2606_01250 [Candidatus Omnitrophica bacterium]|nr:hypothetical protein [Candidatus Omnitrophota bacterium]